MGQPAFKDLPNKVDKKERKKVLKVFSTNHTGIFDQTFFHSIIPPAPEMVVFKEAISKNKNLI